MGTSSARKAPGGKFWRTAKTSMARFASGKEASPPQAKDVVAKYLAALEADFGEVSQDKEFVPTIVRTATSLENFYRHWKQNGLEEALESLGLNKAVVQNREMIVPALLDKMVGTGDTLAEAVTRAALIDHLNLALSSGNFNPTAKPADLDPDNDFINVQTFLGLALFRKLMSDLGESLEFHAPTLVQGIERQEEIRSHILTGIQALKPAGITGTSFSFRQTASILDRILTRLGSRHER